MIQVIARVCQRVDENNNCVAITVLKVRRGGYGIQETLTVLQFSGLGKGHDAKCRIAFDSRICMQ
jgi:hypothetical protein